MTKNIHPLAHAFLEASRDFHNMTDFAAAFMAWDAARDAWCDAGFPIDETAPELADAHASSQSDLPGSINGSEP